MSGSLNYKQISSFSPFSPHRFYHVEASVGPPSPEGFVGSELTLLRCTSLLPLRTLQSFSQCRQTHLHTWFHWTLQPNFVFCRVVNFKIYRVGVNTILTTWQLWHFFHICYLFRADAMDAITLTAFEVWTRNIRKAPRNHVFNSVL